MRVLRRSSGGSDGWCDSHDGVESQQKEWRHSLLRFIKDLKLSFTFYLHTQDYLLLSHSVVDTRAVVDIRL